MLFACLYCVDLVWGGKAKGLRYKVQVALTSG